MSAPHRIRRVIFELGEGTASRSFEVRQRLEAMFEHEFVPELEATFDALAGNRATFTFDRMVVDLGGLDPERLDEVAIRAEIRGQLTAQIERLVAEGGAPERSPVEMAWEGLVHFLGTGRLPWASPFTSLAAMATALGPIDRGQEFEGSVVERLLVRLRTREGAIRLAEAFDDNVVRHVLDALVPGLDQDLVQATLADGATMQVAARVRLLEHAVRALDGPSEGVVPRLHERLRLNPQTDSSNDPTPASGAVAGKDRGVGSRIDEGRGSRAMDSAGTDPSLFVANAGVVLLHPFFVGFFDSLELLDSQQGFATPEDRNAAIAALGHLATGEPRIDESDATILKVLCGESERMLYRQTELRQGVREEALELLSSAIEHWSALKSTSPSALRESFLGRPGRLIRDDAGCHLTMERSSIDVLLGSLPWGLSVIRCPWMAQPLWVDWSA